MCWKEVSYSFSGSEAYSAYAESLAAVTYINDSYGMSDIQRILQRLAEGSSTEAALRATIHSDYGQLEAELGKYSAINTATRITTLPRFAPLRVLC